MNAPLRVPTRTRTLLIARSLLRSFFAVDHPGDAELVHQHTKPKGPECFLDRHCNLSVFCQGMKYAFRLRRILNANVDGEALRFLIAVRRNISTHQYLVARP